MPIIGKILPYLNAFMMVLTTVTNAFARLVGFKLPKFDYSGLKGVGDSALDIEEQMNGASASAEKLKSGLRGFDKLNVISTKKDDSVGSGVDPRIREAFNKTTQEYNDMMDKVQTKASKIADSVSKWLGFEKDINGEYKFRHITLGTIIGALGGILLLLKGASIFKNVFSTIFGIFTGGKVATSVAGVATKTGLLTKGFLALKGALGIGSLATGGVIAVALGAIALAGYGIYKGFQPAVKQIDLFKGVSEETKSALEPFIGKMNDLSLIIKQIDINGIVTESDVSNIKTRTGAITTMLKEDYMKDVEEVEKKLKDKTLYPELSIERRKEILKQVQNSNKDRINEIDKAEKRINEIIKNASLEKRALTGEEKFEINRLQQEMTEQGIKTLTQNEEEQRTILTRIKDNAINLKTEEYSKILQEAIKNRDNLKAESQKKYDEEIALANRLYYDMGAITKEEYDNMLIIAKNSYDTQNREADRGYQQIADTVKTKMGVASKNLDFETGKIKTNFQVFVDTIKNWWHNLSFNKKTINVEGSFSAGGGGGAFGGGGAGFRASGGFPKIGELFVANEAGPEVVSTLGGKSVVANMEQMMLYLDRRIDNKLGGNNTQKQPAVFNISVGNREYAKYMLDDLNDLAKGNGEPITIGG